MKKIVPLMVLSVLAGLFQACAPNLAEPTEAIPGEISGRSALTSSAPVILESAGLRLSRDAVGNRSIKLVGVADLKNLGYAKKLTLHYCQAPVVPADSMAAWADAPGTYLGPDANGYEQWSFSAPAVAVPDAITLDVIFALKYEVNGVTYWDNNAGQNYRLRWFQGYNISHYDGDHGLLNNGPVTLQKAVGSYNSAGTVDATISGLVKNLAYTKKVNLVYSTDHWATTNVASGVYAPSQYTTNPNLGTELWNFTFQGLPRTNLEFALSYQVNGVTYWDNNLGKNYTWNLNNGDLY